MALIVPGARAGTATICDDWSGSCNAADPDAMVEEVGEREVNPVEIHKLGEDPSTVHQT